MMSKSLRECESKHHRRTRHSPDGFNIIEECETCHARWLIQGITGEVIRLWSYPPLAEMDKRTR